MAFSFNPGQATQVTKSSEGEAPPLIVPEAPTISTTQVVEKVSPFAYKNRSKSKFGMYFQFAIFLIFGVVAISSIGLFAYQNILLAQIESKKQELLEKEASFPKMDLDKMQKLSSRIKVINKIINERASVNTAFRLLESAALDNGVTFTKFGLDKSKRVKGYELSFAGETTSYPALYQQIQALNDKKFAKYFTKVAISGIGPVDKRGIAAFRADTVVAIGGIDPDTFTIESSPNVLEVGTTTTSSSTAGAVSP